VHNLVRWSSRSDIGKGRTGCRGIPKDKRIDRDKVATKNGKDIAELQA